MTKKIVNSPYKIGFYIRVSTEEQAETPEGSLRSQECRLRDAVEYKNRHGSFGEPRGIFIDPGISAKDMKRPKLQELLAAIRNGEINLVMVTELSRLSRNTRDFIQMWDMMRAHNCRFLSLREDFDTTTAAGELVLFQLMNLAQFERRQTSERVEANIISRSSRGLYNGGVIPLGYERDLTKPGYLKVDEKGAKIVNAAFEALLKTGCVSQAARWLNENGHKPRKIMQGGRGTLRLDHFSLGNLRYILTNKAYIGIKVYSNKGESCEAPAVWEPIVPRDIFDRAQKIIANTPRGKFKASTPKRFPYILSGVVECATCGDPMIGKSAHGNGGKIGYYEHSWCTRKDSTLVRKIFRCEPHRVPSKVLEPMVWDHFVRFLTNRTRAAEILKSVRQLNRENPDKKRREEVKAKIELLEAQLESLAERIAELPKGVSAASLYKQLERIEAKKTDLEATLLSLGVDGTSSVRRIVDAHTLETFQAKYRSFLGEGTDEVQKRILIKKFIHKIKVGVNSVTIQFYVDKDHYEAELALDSAKFEKAKIFTFDGSSVLTDGPQDWT